VDWSRLSGILNRGGFVGLVLIWFVTILVWGCVSPPEEGAHYILGLTLGNFFGKMVYVTFLFCIMLLCGAVQLRGCCDQYCRITEDHSATDHG